MMDLISKKERRKADCADRGLFYDCILYLLLPLQFAHAGAWCGVEDEV